MGMRVAVKDIRMRMCSSISSTHAHTLHQGKVPT